MNNEQRQCPVINLLLFTGRQGSPMIEPYVYEMTVFRERGWVVKKPVYLALAIWLDGQKELLGPPGRWTASPRSGTKNTR
jgi:hypothetical protein